MKFKYLKIKLVRSLIGKNKKHKLIIKKLGLKKINSTSLIPNNSCTLGMIKKVFYLLKLFNI